MKAIVLSLIFFCFTGIVNAQQLQQHQTILQAPNRPVDGQVNVVFRCDPGVVITSMATRHGASTFPYVMQYSFNGVVFGTTTVSSAGIVTINGNYQCTGNIVTLNIRNNTNPTTGRFNMNWLGDTNSLITGFPASTTLPISPIWAYSTSSTLSANPVPGFLYTYYYTTSLTIATTTASSSMATTTQITTQYDSLVITLLVFSIIALIYWIVLATFSPIIKRKED